MGNVIYYKDVYNKKDEEYDGENTPKKTLRQINLLCQWIVHELNQKEECINENTKNI